MSAWIRVKDQLPELKPDGCCFGHWSESQRVLVYDGHDKSIAIGTLHRLRDLASRWSVVEWDDFSYVQVTHWMPLPEPPK
jgi:Protein of unknown function (DUF551)